MVLNIFVRIKNLNLAVCNSPGWTRPAGKGWLQSNYEQIICKSNYASIELSLRLAVILPLATRGRCSKERDFVITWHCAACGWEAIVFRCGPAFSRRRNGGRDGPGRPRAVFGASPWPGSVGGLGGRSRPVFDVGSRPSPRRQGVGCLPVSDLVAKQGAGSCRPIGRRLLKPVGACKDKTKKISVLFNIETSRHVLNR